MRLVDVDFVVDKTKVMQRKQQCSLKRDDYVPVEYCIDNIYSIV